MWIDYPKTYTSFVNGSNLATASAGPTSTSVICLLMANAVPPKTIQVRQTSNDQRWPYSLGQARYAAPALFNLSDCASFVSGCTVDRSTNSFPASDACAIAASTTPATAASSTRHRQMMSAADIASASDCTARVLLSSAATLSAFSNVRFHTVMDSSPGAYCARFLQMAYAGQFPFRFCYISNMHTSPMLPSPIHVIRVIINTLLESCRDGAATSQPQWHFVLGNMHYADTAERPGSAFGGRSAHAAMSRSTSTKRRKRLNAILSFVPVDCGHARSRYWSARCRACSKRLVCGAV